MSLPAIKQPKMTVFNNMAEHVPVELPTVLVSLDAIQMQMKHV
jgi:hypothetical protein